jgi:CBS-domain-containing membrane protein
MTCSAIMTRDVKKVSEDESIGAAARLIVEHRYINLPVVDKAGRFVGMFGIYELLGLLVPRIAVVGNLLPNLRFMSDDIGELHATFAKVKNSPLRRAVNREAASVHPDTPVVEALRLLCRNHTTIPVVERETNKLIGIVSYWDAARAILDGPAGGK